ncbi:hypothetical protein BT69DRAFT_1280818 [Atractiella rhizophila]|nr:hypothetical protein BT69DRAFT_1280818 [Atractiella rhizophila]
MYSETRSSNVTKKQLELYNRFYNKYMDKTSLERQLKVIYILCSILWSTSILPNDSESLNSRPCPPKQ